VQTQLYCYCRRRLLKMTVTEDDVGLPWSAVCRTDDPLLVDDAAAAEVSAAGRLQGHLPRPAVRHRLDAADHSHVDARQDGRPAALGHSRRNRHAADARRRRRRPRRNSKRWNDDRRKTLAATSRISVKTETVSRNTKIKICTRIESTLFKIVVLVG